jgi:3-hydroxy-9,10-secoandrosta-1,3,5(10)-triene-9,17-dione monooxygenase reductase component
MAEIDPHGFKAVMGYFATGVSVVAAMEEGRPVGFTCQSVVSLSLEPAYVALAPAKSSTSWPKIARAGSFCVSILAESQAHIGRRFSLSGGDKFAGVGWQPSPSSGSPRLDGALAWIDCDLELIHDAGDHEMVIGRVRSLGLARSVEDDTATEGPLIFYRGGWRRIATD